MKLVLSVIIIMFPVLFFGFRDQAGIMSIVLIASVICVALINIDSFKSFKVGKVFEATMREAKETIEEANATIDQLKAVTAPLLKANLSFLLYEGVFDGMPADEQASTFLELLKIKESLGIHDMDEHFSQTAKGVSSHYFIALFRDLEERNDEFREKYYKYTTIHHAPETPSVKELENFFENHPYFLNDEIKDNYENFKEIKENFVNE